MKAILTFIALILIAGKVFSSTEISCEYLTEKSGKPTKIFFSLPHKVIFGELVVIDIKPASGVDAKMNTVILKDYPFIVLSDVYRIEEVNSKSVLFKVSPDKSDIEIAFINMGNSPSAKFYKGDCQMREG